MGIATTEITLENKLLTLPVDGPGILSKLEMDVEEDVIEFVSELPAAVNSAALIAQVSRWREVQTKTGKNLRIYGWSYNDEVEKRMLSMVQNMDHVFLTVLPYTLRKRVYE